MLNIDQIIDLNILNLLFQLLTFLLICFLNMLLKFYIFCIEKKNYFMMVFFIDQRSTPKIFGKFLISLVLENTVMFCE